MAAIFDFDSESRRLVAVSLVATQLCSKTLDSPSGWLFIRVDNELMITRFSLRNLFKKPSTHFRSTRRH